MQSPVPLPPWVDTYLKFLEETGLEHSAAAAAGTTVRTARSLMQRNVEFMHACEEALERATDRLEAEARRRALEGVDKGIYYEGDRVATEKVYSDSLMALFLKSKRRRQFGDKAEITGPGGGPLQVAIRKFSPGTTLDGEYHTVSATTPLAPGSLPYAAAELAPLAAQAAIEALTADDLV